MHLKIKRLRDIPLPAYGREGDAAFDLRAAGMEGPLTLQPGERAELFTGLAFAIPNGFVGLVFPRSGLGKKGLTLANGTGVIDANYRGEVMMNVVNTGPDAITIQPLDRLMQMAIVPVANCQFTEVDTLDETNRGAAGFNSSGTR